MNAVVLFWGLDWHCQKNAWFFIFAKATNCRDLFLEALFIIIIYNYNIMNLWYPQGRFGVHRQSLFKLHCNWKKDLDVLEILLTMAFKILAVGSWLQIRVWSVHLDDEHWTLWSFTPWVEIESTEIRFDLCNFFGVSGFSLQEVFWKIQNSWSFTSKFQFLQFPLRWLSPEPGQLWSRSLHCQRAFGRARQGGPRSIQTLGTYWEWMTTQNNHNMAAGI